MKYFNNTEKRLTPLRDDIDYGLDYLEERKQFIEERKREEIQKAEEACEKAKREAEEKAKKALAEITDHLKAKAPKPQWTDVSNEFCAKYQKRHKVSYWD